LREGWKIDASSARSSLKGLGFGGKRFSFDDGRLRIKVVKELKGVAEDGM